MPIDGLTDSKSISPSMPRLGKLRKGGKKTKPNEPGPDLEYFRLDCDDPRIVAAFTKEYGNQPRQIDIVLPFDTIGENFPTWRVERGKHSLKHKCDGKTMVLWQDENGIHHTEPKPCPYKDLPKGDPGRKCKEKGILKVIVPCLVGLRWGYLEVLTGSKWDCWEITQNLAEVQLRAQQISIITGNSVTMKNLPCLLWRGPSQVSCPLPDGKRIMQEKSLLHVEIKPEYMKKLIYASQAFALPVIESPLQLEAPDLDYDSNGDDIEHPETEVVDESEAENNGNGHKPQRPYDLETLKRGISQKVTKYKGKKKPTEAQLNSARAGLSSVTADDAERHALTLWLFDKESSSDLTAAECSAIIKWIGADPPDYEPNGYAVEEARQIIRAYQVMVGQQEMELL